jgi:Amino-transferase class IV
MKGGFNLFNGKFYRDSEPLFSGQDLVRLSSGLKESFRAVNNLVMFARSNYDFLLDSLSALGLPIPADWNFSRFTSDCSRFLNKNHFYLAAKIDIYFIPGIDGTEYLLTGEEIPGGFFKPKEVGLLIDIYTEGAKNRSVYQSYEPSSRTLWDAATRHAMESSRHNLILLNNKGFACESINGSFGYLIEHTAVFPSAASQGYSPPLIEVVKSCAQACGFEILEKKEITKEELLNAEELFLINNCRGIEPVLGLYARRYYTTGGITIATKLAEKAKNEHRQD